MPSPTPTPARPLTRAVQRLPAEDLAVISGNCQKVSYELALSWRLAQTQTVAVMEAGMATKITVALEDDLEARRPRKQQGSWLAAGSRAEIVYFDHARALFTGKAESLADGVP